MNFVTIPMLAEHAGRHIKTVRNALKAAAVKMERTPGVAGYRIPLATANRFLAKQWPEVGPLPTNTPQ